MSIARKGTCNSFCSLVHVYSFILFSFTGPNIENMLLASPSLSYSLVETWQTLWFSEMRENLQSKVVWWSSYHLGNNKRKVVYHLRKKNVALHVNMRVWVGFVGQDETREMDLKRGIILPYFIQESWRST